MAYICPSPPEFGCAGYGASTSVLLLPSNMDIAGTNAGNSCELVEDGCYVGLTELCLDPKSVMDKVRSPAAGAIVLFAGMSQKRPQQPPRAGHRKGAAAA